MERKQHADREFLYKEHIVLGKPMSQIAKECGVSGDTIRRNMIKCDIKYWTTQYREKLSDTQIDEIAELYCVQKLSANERTASCLKQKCETKPPRTSTACKLPIWLR